MKVTSSGIRKLIAAMMMVILRSYRRLRRKEGMSCGRGVAVRAAFQDKLICVGDQIEQIYNH
jgi:hypothetical protein